MDWNILSHDLNDPTGTNRGVLIIVNLTVVYQLIRNISHSFLTVLIQII
jgi:hypothetical protein